MKLTDYDAYLFDLDGTLARTLDVWLQAMHKLLARHGVTGVPDKDIVLKTFGRVREGALEVGVSEAQLPAFMDEIKRIAPDVVAEASLYEGAHDVLATLKRDGKKLALITASVEEVVDVVMRRNDLLGMFDVIITGDKVAKHKPDPEGINTALKGLGVSPERAVMLGDSDKDLQAANNAGIDSVLFFPDEHELFHDRDALSALRPAHTLKTWHELIQALQGGDE